MEDKLFSIDGVQSLTEAEALSINGGALSFIGNMFKLGFGIGAGWLIAEGVRSC